MLKSLVTAIRTLTIVPIPGKDAERFSGSLPFFPLAGALIGCCCALISWLVGGDLRWPLGAAASCIAFSSLITGGLHLDGLGDVFDASGASTRERKLEIMKDPRMGSYGVVAIVVVLLLKFAAFHRISGHGAHLALILPFVLSRTAQVAFMVFLPYARPGGGTAQGFVEGAGPRHLFIATAIAALICWAIGREFGLILLGAAVVPAGLLVLWMKRVFGGVTGDLVGMGSEIIETFLLMATAFAVGGLI